MDEQTKRGLDLLQRMKFKDASAEFEQVLQRNPNDRDALAAIVNIARKLGPPETLETALTKLVELTPNNIQLRVQHIIMHATSHNFEFARAQLNIMMRLIEVQKPDTKAIHQILLAINIASQGTQRTSLLLRLRRHLANLVNEAKDNAAPLRLIMGFINISLQDYDQFLITAASINQNELANPLKRRLNNLVMRLESPAFPDFNQPKVFGIGLSRTGTTSLYNALERLGYNSLHWLNHDTADLISQPDFFLYDSFTDTSVSHQFEWLYHTFPNSKFILTTRDFNSWHKSIARHYALKRNISGASKLATSSSRHMYQGRVNLIEQNLYAQHDTWKGAFDAFNRRVEHFFKDKPKDRLLTLNIPGGDGWSALCRYLDKPVPDEDFRHLIKRSSRTRPSRALKTAEFT